MMCNGRTNINLYLNITSSRILVHLPCVAMASPLDTCNKRLVQDNLDGEIVSLRTLQENVKTFTSMNTTYSDGVNS